MTPEKMISERDAGTDERASLDRVEAALPAIHEKLGPAAWRDLYDIIAELRLARRKLDLIEAPGSQLYPSKLNHGKVVMVDGRTDLDACERDTDSCFDTLFREMDGEGSPGRLYIGLGQKGPVFVLDHGLPSSPKSAVAS